MSVLATDNFNRANGALGANWAVITGMSGYQIVSNQVSTNSDPDGVRYTAITFPDDQYAQTKVTGPASAGTHDGPGPAIRIASGAQTFYFMQSAVDENQVWKVVATSFTQLKTDAVGAAANSVTRLQVQGTTLLAQKNGVNLFSGEFTDAAIGSGWTGAGGSASPDTITFDDWEAGNLFVDVVAARAFYTGFPKPKLRQPISAGRVI